jgi:hypothetical protein
MLEISNRSLPVEQEKFGAGRQLERCHEPFQYGNLIGTKILTSTKVLAVGSKNERSMILQA